MSNLATLFTAMYEKLQTNSSGAPVFLTELSDPLSELDEGSRRIEIEMLEADADFYQSQRDLEWEIPVLITGYIKNVASTYDVKNNWSITDHVAILDFAAEIISLVYSLLDDKQNGLPLPGFIRFAGKAKIVVDMEIIPNVMVFSSIVTPVILQSDTTV